MNPLDASIRDALASLFCLHDAEVATLTDVPDPVAPRTGPGNLRWMCRTAISNVTDYPTDKLARWLGFTRACLTERGVPPTADILEADIRLYAAAHSAPPDHGAVRAVDAELLHRYTGILAPVVDVAPRVFPQFTADQLRALCSNTLAGVDRLPLVEVNVRLGFIQGCLTLRGLVTADGERDFSRQRFHNAYRREGIAIPPTRTAPKE